MPNTANTRPSRTFVIYNQNRSIGSKSFSFVFKLSKIVKNGLKKNGQKWSKLSKTVKSGQKRSTMVNNGQQFVDTVKTI